MTKYIPDTSRKRPKVVEDQARSTSANQQASSSGKHFNDSPIEKPEDDRYGMAPFAGSIAKSILNIKAPEGTTIALHGAWGSGKSSAVNLIRYALDRADDKKLVVTEFNGWWYRGDEALALAFLQNLHAALKRGLGDKIKDFIPKITRRVLQAGPVIGTASSLMVGQPSIAALFSKVSTFASAFFSDDETVQETFNKLATVLKKSDERFLVIIDDIDRLLPDEALAIFRLVKSVGRLPNVMYLLVFDRKLAEKTVLERYPSEGPHFLEKIIQAGFELPSPIQTDLNDAVLTSVNEICGSPNEAQIVYFMNLFYDVLVPYITTPRHVVRLRNAISVTWPAICNDVNLGDFIALETIRLYEPGLFDAIRTHKSAVCGTRQSGDPDQHDENRFSAFFHGVPENHHALAKLVLQRLFPRLEHTGYGSEWISQWAAERRVCVEAHYDTYFRLTLSDEALSSTQIDELIQRAGDQGFIQKTFKNAAATKRKGGKSMVPVYLNELTTHAARVAKDDVRPLVTALFFIHDQIDLEQDAERGFMELGDTSLRFHWLIRRLTKNRFSIDERTSLYLAATKKADLGWLVDFVSSARHQYDKNGNKAPTREEDCLVTEAALDPLTTGALNVIRAAAAGGSLLNHQDLVYILYRWRDFLSNPVEVRAWIDGLLSDDRAVAILARAMTSRSWSAGMGGFGSLGDRVATPSAQVQISDETDIIDVKTFRSALERVRDKGKIEAKELEDVKTFLEAWDGKRRGEH
jgi:predicted KAP-like P-loop ATPase